MVHACTRFHHFVVHKSVSFRQQKSVIAETLIGSLSVTVCIDSSFPTSLHTYTVK